MMERSFKSAKAKIMRNIDNGKVCQIPQSKLKYKKHGWWESAILAYGDKCI